MTARGAGQGCDWRPIDSAPKDKSILLGSPETGDDPAISTLGWWEGPESDGMDYMGHDGGFVDYDYSTYRPGRSIGNPKSHYPPRQPTHWQPLPEPPAAPSSMADGGRTG